MVGRAWGIIGITIPNEVLMGVLNSKIALFIMKLKLPAKQGGYFKISSDFLNNFPIPFIKQPDKMKHAVDRAIQLTKNLREVSDQNSNEAQRLKAEIEKTDAEIDRLVYELYGLTAEEIKIVEDSIK
jgi:hypothetical protein